MRCWNLEKINKKLKNSSKNHSKMVERPYFGVWNGLISGVSSLHVRLNLKCFFCLFLFFDEGG